jgi:hypothetical protein
VDVHYQPRAASPSAVSGYSRRPWLVDWRFASVFRLVSNRPPFFESARRTSKLILLFSPSFDLFERLFRCFRRFSKLLHCACNIAYRGYRPYRGTAAVQRVQCIMDSDHALIRRRTGVMSSFPIWGWGCYSLLLSASSAAVLGRRAAPCASPSPHPS